MSDPIDWEAKFHKAVSTNVRQSDEHKRKSAATLIELQQARQRIADLERQVQTLTPAGDALAQERAAHLKDNESSIAQIRDLRKTIRLWEEWHAAGVRGVLVSAVANLQKQIDGLPVTATAPEVSG